MKSMLRLFLVPALLCTMQLYAQFAPPAGVPGTTAMYKDSSAFVAWATGCTVQRGPMDISNTALGTASAGDSSMALGLSGSNAFVSLGDGGSATLTFDNPVYNGPGWDFAVFENSFDGQFLELAFVEVSSDGVNFVRFPATSNTQDTVQKGPFDLLDATKLNNLAGKYIAFYGTPFDLSELTGSPGIDLNAIRYVRVVDAVGSVLPQYASYDINGNAVNDPWATPFASCGFDLEAVGVIHQLTGISSLQAVVSSITIFPQPVSGSEVQLSYTLTETANVAVQIIDAAGKIVAQHSQGEQQPGNYLLPLTVADRSRALYFIRLQAGNSVRSVPLVFYTH
ncbi:MAG: T9SS type A sorting domain-containing protein [Bacteroidetes bacterium]|nr:T9SS type A sorting domain-containing protein [Bacteroidota bacterium]